MLSTHHVLAWLDAVAKAFVRLLLLSHKQWHLADMTGNTPPSLGVGALRRHGSSHSSCIQAAHSVCEAVTGEGYTGVWFMLASRGLADARESSLFVGSGWSAQQMGLHG
jgi:hypothetical protein